MLLLLQVVKDQQVLMNGGVVEIARNAQDEQEGTAQIFAVNNPVDFDGVSDTHRSAVPGKQPAATPCINAIPMHPPPPAGSPRDCSTE